jgi:hypothetical protein
MLPILVIVPPLAATGEGTLPVTLPWAMELVGGVGMVLQRDEATRWRPLRVAGFDQGINFYGQFSDRSANQALAAMHTVLEDRGTPCYCLRLAIDDRNKGYFQRYGDVLVPDTVSPPLRALTWTVPLERLVADLETWPPLAVCEGPPTGMLEDTLLDPALREFLNRVRWQIAIRLQNNRSSEFVGYFKFLGIDDSCFPEDHDILAAANIAMLEVERHLALRHIQAMQVDDNFKERLHTTAGKIADLQPEEARLAFHYVADMLTSHLGAGWNRAACYWPMRDDRLRCVWAQGGNGDWSWCQKVQAPISQSVHEVDVLTELAKNQPRPWDDAYYCDAAGGRPLEVSAVNDPSNGNILASLWCAKGDICRLHPDRQCWEVMDVHPENSAMVDRRKFTQGFPPAAEFGQQDRWVQEVQHERPGSAIFTSRNGRYFSIPWFSRRDLIGVWVVDNAYWGVLSGQPDAPSLTLTRQILDRLGPAMEQHRRVALWMQQLPKI